MAHPRANPVRPSGPVTDAEPSAAFTPGPWEWVYEVVDEPNGLGWWRLSPGILIADGDDGTPDGDERDQANARLIAVAPELLAALRRVQRWINTSVPIGTEAATTMLGAVNEAIAKALAHDRPEGSAQSAPEGPGRTT